MTRGAEQFCLGIVDHDNIRGRKYEEVRSVFKDIAPHSELLRSNLDAEVAVVYDYDNIWSWRFQPQSESFDFTTELLRLYNPFYQLNCRIDVIPADRDFSRYKVLLLPVMQIIDEDLAERLKAFTAAGGTVVFSFRTGLKDRTNNLRFGEMLPGLVADLCGIRIEAAEALPSGQAVPIQAASEAVRYGLPEHTEATVWRDLLVPVTAEPLYQYQDPFFPAAAVTRNPYGKGEVYYIGCGLGAEALGAIAQIIVNRQDIFHIESDSGVEVVIREHDGRRWCIVLNHTAEAKTFRDLSLKPYDSKIMPLDQIFPVEMGMCGEGRKNGNT